MRFFLLGCLLLLGTFGVTVHVANAAVISLGSDFGILHVGDVITVKVRVDTERQTINAIESDITFPNDILSYVSSDDSDSVVSLWVQKPVQVGSSQIHFSGVTPGGFIEANAPVLTLTFQVIKTGQAVVQLHDTALLLNDGAGTPAAVTEQSLHISSTPGSSSTAVHIVDTELPEPFTPRLIVDPDVYGGQSTLIFATNDKGSGMDHYEVKEGVWGTYGTTQSPYEMKHQALDTPVYIKAIDRAGNVRLETFYPHNWQPWYKAKEIIGTILVLCVLLLGAAWIFCRRMWCR